MIVPRAGNGSIGARIADPSPGGLSGEDPRSMSSPDPYGRERLATSAITKFADAEYIRQQVGTAKPHFPAAEFVACHNLHAAKQQALELGPGSVVREEDCFASEVGPSDHLLFR
jgi:hypothetical protein